MNCCFGHLLFGKARVDDKHHPVDGEGGLCNVGRHHHLAPHGSVGLGGRGRLKDPLLEGWRQGGVERDALDVAHLRAEVVHLSLNPLATLLNFLVPEAHSWGGEETGKKGGKDGGGKSRRK